MTLTDEINNLVVNIGGIVQKKSNEMAKGMASRHIGRNLGALDNAITAAENADKAVELELLKHIKSQPDQEGVYYRSINTRKKDKILEDLQQKFDRQYSIVTDARNLFEALNNTENVNAGDYYKLKNDDVKEKIKDISGIELTNKRKAIYNLDYVNNIQKMKETIYTIYVIMSLIYIVFFIRAKKYRSKLEILILILVILYPFFINKLMKYILGILDYVFKLAPVNAYRNLYDNNINLSTSRDNDIYMHYSKVRDD